MSRTNPATAGDNVTPLTEDEQGALTVHHALEILRDRKVAAQKKADYEAANAVVNGHFKMVSKDLNYTRKEFEAEVIEKLGMTDAEYRNAEARRAKLHRLAGLKPGDQIDLIAHVLPDTVDEALAAEADGYRAGRRADDPFPPENISPVMQPDWLRGYHAGQEFNGLQLAKAAEVLARPKPGEMVAGSDPDDDDEQIDVEDVVDQGARDLRANGWAEPTSEEAEFEEADGGKTVRKPRPSRVKAPAQAEAA